MRKLTVLLVGLIGTYLSSQVELVWAEHIAAPTLVLFGAQLGKTMGYLDLDVVPEDAEVYINDEKRGICDQYNGIPDYLYLEAGTYRISFRRQGYLDYTREIRVRSGSELEFNTRLEPSPAGSGPPDSFDYDRIESKPKLSRGPEDEYESQEQELASVGKADHEKAEHDRNANTGVSSVSDTESSNQEQSDQENGAKHESILKCRLFPREASLYVDDRFQMLAGQANDSENGLLFAPGNHTINLILPGHISAHQNITLEADKTYYLKMILVPESPDAETDQPADNE
ncbi:PEGA domain-containing protein [bacterium]|nr:PEGA domain-containing protein [bacterium]